MVTEGASQRRFHSVFSTSRNFADQESIGNKRKSSLEFRHNLGRVPQNSEEQRNKMKRFIFLMKNFLLLPAAGLTGWGGGVL